MIKPIIKENFLGTTMNAGAFLFSLVLFTTYVSAGTMNVQIKSAALKTTPSFLAQTIATLHYGDSVNTLQENGEWIEVKSSSKKGWLHTSALTAKEIILTSTSKTAPKNVSSNEVMMAGKGFNAQVENQYRHQNPSLRFDLVDKMEKYSVSSDTQRQFVKNGQLAQ